MASFRIRVEDIIGSVPSLGDDSSNATDQAVTDALTDTALEVFNLLPEQILYPYSVRSSIATSNPVINDIEGMRILGAERQNGNDAQTVNYISCVFIDPTLVSKVQHPKSIYFATQESPVWTIFNRDLYIFPAPGTGGPYDDANGAIAITVTAPTVLQTDSSISVFPNELEHVVVLGACARLKQRQISFFNEDEDGELVQLHRAQYQELQQKYQETLSPFISRDLNA